MVATIGPPSVTTWVLCLFLSLGYPAHTVSVSHLGNRKGFRHELPSFLQICRWLLPENASSAPALPSSSDGARGDSSSAPSHPPPQHSGPSPVRIQAIDLVSLHPGIAWDPPLRTLSSQPSMWASSSWPHPCPSSPSSHSLTRSAHKCQQKTVAFSISSSIVQHLSN